MADSRPPVPGEEFDELPKDDFTPAEVNIKQSLVEKYWVGENKA